MRSCDLCSRRFEKYDRNFGLDLCHFCTAGEFDHRLLARHGVSCKARTWTVTRPGRNFGDHRITHHIQVRGIVLRAFRFKVAFKREHVGHALIKRFSRELQVGDELFDDAVYIDTEMPAALWEFVGRTEVQSALMYLVGMIGPVRIENGLLLVEARGSPTPYDGASAALAAVVVLCALKVSPSRSSS